jgi:chondroitin 4-sulfotransferase 11
MISYQHKFLFIHIPKAAGTSIESALFPFADESHGSEFAVKSRCWRNMELFLVSENFPEFFSFTFVREPRERFISAWNHFKGSERNTSVENFLRKTEIFLAQNPGQLYRQLPANETRFDILNRKIHAELATFTYPFNSTIVGYHLLPQCYFLYGKVDHIGRFENIATEFQQISSQIFGNAIKLNHKRKKRHESYEKILDASQLSRVEKLYQEDIERLGY